MTKHIGYGIIVAFAMVLSACGGGGSPAPSTDLQTSTSGSREVSGRLVAADGTSPTATSGGTTACALADGVTVTNSAGTTVNYIVAANCSFNFTVNVHEVNHVHFTREAKPVAELAVGPDSFGEGSINFIVGDGAGPVQLGIVIVANGSATVNVKQDDTIIIAKPDTLDCDLDCIPDEFDGDTVSCTVKLEPKDSKFFAVLPLNNEAGTLRAELDSKIFAKANCSIDAKTVTADTFKVTTKDGASTLACTLEVKDNGATSKILCTHDLMLENTAYVATADGIKCSTGETLPKISWQWTTEPKEITPPPLPDSREITGSLSGSADATGECSLADTIAVTSSAGTTTNYEVAADCSFSFSVKVNETNTIAFAKDGSTVATLSVGADLFGEENFSFLVIQGSGAIHLGTLTIANGIATITLQPLDASIIIVTPDTPDCDLDGLPDDLDEDEATCLSQPDPKEPRIFAVLPPNDPNAEGKNRVKVDKAIRASANCAIDTATLTADTFKITTKDGISTLACTLTIKASASGSMSQIRCAHDLMLANTAYVATIDGVKCTGDISLPKTTWQWATKENVTVVVDSE